jgi:cytidine deaminase
MGLEKEQPSFARREGRTTLPRFYLLTVLLVFLGTPLWPVSSLGPGMDLGRIQRTMKTKRPSKPEIMTLGQVKKVAILAAVEQLHGNVRLAAENLQISETTLQRKLKEYRVIIKQRREKERKSSLGQSRDDASAWRKRNCTPCGKSRQLLDLSSASDSKECMLSPEGGPPSTADW